MVPPFADIAEATLHYKKCRFYTNVNSKIINFTIVLEAWEFAPTLY